MKTSPAEQGSYEQPLGPQFRGKIRPHGRKWQRAVLKIPTSLKRKAKKDPELPRIEWKLLEKKKKSGVAIRSDPRIPREIQRKTKKRGLPIRSHTPEYELYTTNPSV